MEAGTGLIYLNHKIIEFMLLIPDNHLILMGRYFIILPPEEFPERHSENISDTVLNIIKENVREQTTHRNYAGSIS